MPATIDSRSPCEAPESETRSEPPGARATSPDGTGVASGTALGVVPSGGVGTGVGVGVGVATTLGVGAGAGLAGGFGFVGRGLGAGATEPHLSANTTAHIFLPSGPL